MGGNLTRVYTSSKSVENVNVYIPNLQNLRNYQKLRCYTVNSPILTYNKRYLLQEKISVFEELKSESCGNSLCSKSSVEFEKKPANLEKLLEFLKYISEENQSKTSKIDLDRFLNSLGQRPQTPNTEFKIIIENQTPTGSQDIMATSPENLMRDNNTSLKDFAEKMIKSYFVTHVIVFLAGKVQSIVNSIPNIFKTLLNIKPLKESKFDDKVDCMSKYDKRTKSYLKNILDNLETISIDYQKRRIISDIKTYQKLSNQIKLDKNVKILYQRKSR